MTRLKGHVAKGILVLAICAVPAAGWTAEVGAGGSAAVPAKVTGEVVLSGELVLEGISVVDKGATLILAPGVRIRAGKDAALSVMGRIEIRGTEEEPVVLTGGDDGPWKGISFYTGAAGDVRGMKLSGARTGVSVIAAEVNVRRSEISRCEKGLHLIREAVNVTEGVTFSANGLGVAVEMKSRSRINRCRFSDNGTGISIASGALPVIANNRFEGNGFGIQVYQRYPERIRSNVFTGNRIGIRLYQNGPDTVVERNLFKDSSEGAVLTVSFSSPTVVNNRMSGGRFGVFANQFSSPTVVNNHISDMDEALHLNKKNVSRITGNLIQGSETGIFCDFSSYPLIRGNHFDGNATHIRLGRFQSSHWEQEAGSKQFVMRTAAQAGSRNPKLAEGPEKFPETVDATGNWWDETTVRDMDASGPEGNLDTIFDGHDLPEVTYDGFGEQKYRIDKVVSLPRKEGDPVAAGLEGWRGTEGELDVP